MKLIFQDTKLKQPAYFGQNSFFYQGRSSLKGSSQKFANTSCRQLELDFGKWEGKLTGVISSSTANDTLTSLYK